MKCFLAVITAFFLAIPMVRAQESPDDQYVIIYVMIQQGDASVAAGETKQALGDYVEAQRELQKFQQVYSDWNPKIVSFRLNYLAQKIASLTPQTQTLTPNAPAPVQVQQPPPTPADWQAQLTSLNGNIQQFKGENDTLQSKLKEALSVQPEAESPAALALLQQQVRDLNKQNDLLRATVAQMTNTVPTNAAPQKDPVLLAALATQTAHATQLTAENESLEARILNLTVSADAADALRQENAVLKKQLAGLNLPATQAAASSGGDLTAARAQISQLQSEAADNWLEKTALENRVKQLQEAEVATAMENTPDAAGLQAQVAALKAERDGLLAQLGEANKKLSVRKNESASAQMDALAAQIETLRDRIAIDEGQTVPYTPQELALFTPEPLTADPQTEKKSIHSLPGSTAVLVAEAQSYFTNREYDKAAADYQEVVNQNTNNPLALANLASAELQQNKITDADAHINAAMALEPNDPFNLTVLGRVRFSEGNLDGAIDALDQAVKLAPENPQIENFLGVALAQKGLRVQAETAFRKAVQLNPNYGDAHKNLAIIYLSTSPPMVEMARWHYEKALMAGVPSNPDIEKMLDANGVNN